MPELYDDLAYIWKAFWDLHGRRQYGYGPCPLSITDIMEYARAYEVRNPREFFEYISSMDNEWMIYYGNTKSSD
jgi:hypothetical protein